MEYCRRKEYFWRNLSEPNAEVCFVRYLLIIYCCTLFMHLISGNSSKSFCIAAVKCFLPRRPKLEPTPGPSSVFASASATSLAQGCISICHWCSNASLHPSRGSAIALLPSKDRCVEAPPSGRAGAGLCPVLALML